MPNSQQTVLDDPDLVLRSANLLGAQRTEVAAHFYGRLFGRHPHLEAYFQNHDALWRERMFVTALRSMMMAANSPSSLDKQLDDLVERHREHQIHAEHFDLFVDVLLETLAYYAGDQWTPDVAAAWASVASKTAAALSAGASSEEGHAACR
jgi:hemoglobin-like flavoprotein